MMSKRKAAYIAKVLLRVVACIKLCQTYKSRLNLINPTRRVI